MSTRYIKGERFRVRSHGWTLPPLLIVEDDVTVEENTSRVLAVFAAERHTAQHKDGPQADLPHGRPKRT